MEPSIDARVLFVYYVDLEQIEYLHLVIWTFLLYGGINAKWGKVLEQRSENLEISGITVLSYRPSMKQTKINAQDPHYFTFHFHF